MKFSGFNTTEKVGIGIGTNVPSRPLEVNGTGNASVIRVGDGDTDGAAAIAYIEFGANSTSWDRHSYVGSAGADSHLWIVNEENADIKFYANNAEKMVINNDGNVGIGTTAPSHPLHVYSTVGNASAILIDGSASNSGYLSFRQAGVEKAYIQYTANSYLRYSKAGGFHSFAQAVAIGTTAVGSYALYVNGTGYFGGPITTTANSAGCSSVWKAYSSGYGVNKYQTNAGVDKWNIGLNSSNEFYIYNYAASEVALKFDTSSNTTFSGALTGTGRITAKVGSGNEASIVIDNNASGKAGDAYLRYAVYNGVYWATGIDNSDVDKFKISKSSDLGTNDFLTIDTAGLVGIGTTAPGYKLDVNGTANIVGALTGTSATFSGAVELSTAGSTLYLRNAENTGNHYIRPTTGKLTINNASGTEVAVTSTGLAVTGTGSFTGALSGTSADFSGALTATGNFTTQGYVQHTGYLYSRDNLAVLNAAGSGWKAWATRSNSEFNLDVGTITSGALTGTSATFSGTVTGALNGTLGATTPATVAATTITASGLITRNSVAATNTEAVRYTGTTSGSNYSTIVNTIGSSYWGTDSSAGQFTGTPYAFFITSGQPIVLTSGGVKAAVITSTGLAVTGTGSFTGALTGTTAAFNSTATGNIAVLKSTATSNNTELRLGTTGDNAVITGSGGSNGGLEFITYGAQRALLNATGLAVTGAISSTTGANLATASGSVGIGTTAPAAPLHVTSSVATDTEIIRIQNLGSSSANVWISLYRGGTENGRLSTSYDQLTLQARNNKNVNIFDDSGNGLTVADGGAATFSGSVRAEDRFDLYDAANVWQFKNVGGLFSLRNGNTGAVPISITSAGAATFSGALTGTTATFSGNVSITNTAANAILTLNPTVSVYSIIKMYGAGSIANGLDITVGQANAYYSAGAHTFRNAAQSANYGVFSSTGLAVTGTGSFTGQLTLQNDDATLRVRSNTTTTKGVTLRYNHAGSFGELRSDQAGVNQLDMKYYALTHKFGRNDSLQYLTIDASGMLHIKADNAYLDIKEADGTAISYLGDLTGAGVGGTFLYNHGGTATIQLRADANHSFINTGGNFGIGTTAPGGKLDVIDSSSTAYATPGSGRTPVGALIRINNSNTTAGNYVGLDLTANGSTTTGGQHAYIGAVGNSGGYAPDIVIGQSTAASTTTERIRIKADGKVGIGAAPSAHKLEVLGSNNIAKFYSSDTATELKINAPTVNVIGLYTGTSDALVLGTADTERMRIDASGNVGWRGSHTAEVGKLFATDTDNAAISATNELAIYVNNANVRAMHIDSLGRVGIGTTAPGGLLELKTNANNFIGLLITQQQNQSAIHITNPQNTTAWSLKIDGTGNLTTGGLARFKNGSANTSTRSLVQIWNDNALATGTTSLEVVNDSTGAAAIFTGGNVGIGTASPSSKFHIWDGTTVDAFKVENYNRGAIWNSVGAGGMYSEYQLTGTWKFRLGQANHLVSGASVNDFAFSYAGNLLFSTSVTERMRITDSGKVGIGTNNPLNLLTLHQAAGANIRFSNPTTGRYFIVGEGVGANDKFSFRGNSYRSTDTLTVDFANNRVGIGTISPSEMLDIETGDAGGHIELNNPDSGGNSFVIGITDTAVPGYGVAGSLFIRDGGSSRFVLTSSGYVGIGTTAPATLLSNTSTRIANADGLTVSTSGLNWVLDAQGYVAALSNLATSDNHIGGLLVEIGGTGGTNKILDLESGGVNRVRVLGNGNTTFSGTVNASYVVSTNYAQASSLRIPSTTNYHEIWNSGDELRIYRNQSAAIRIGASNLITLGGALTGTSATFKLDAGLTLERTSVDSRFRMFNTGGEWILAATYGSTGAYDPIKFQTSDVTRLTIAANGVSTFSGDVGIGVTPETWHSSYTALQFAGNGALSGWGNQQAGAAIYLSQNSYLDQTAWKYISTDEASRYEQVNGTHTFSVATSGTADAAITWITALALANTGAATFSGTALFSDGLVGSPSISFAGDTDTGIWRPGSNQLWFVTTGVNRLKIDGSGNTEVTGELTVNSTVKAAGKLVVGSTATPTSKFQIHSTQSDTMTDAEAFLALYGNGGDGLLMGQSASSPYGAWIQAGYLPNIGTSHHYPLILQPHGSNVGIGTTAPAQKLDIVGGHIRLDSGLSLSWDNSHERIEAVNTGIIKFFTNNSQAMTLSGSNLGIGTTSPGAKLEIDAGGATDILLGVISDSTTYNAISLNGAITDAGKLGFAGGGGGNTNSQSKLYYDVPSTGQHVFRVATSQKVVFDASGKVGIGTTAPGAKLHVSASNTSAAIYADQASSGYIFIGRQSATNRFRITNKGATLINTDYNNNGTSLVVTHGGGSSSYAATFNGGKVGIGTAAPAQTLDVSGNISIYSRSTASSGEIDKLIFQKQHTNGVSGPYVLGEIRSFTGNGYSGGLNFYTGRSTGGGAYASTFAMQISEEGKVGIGTTNPGKLLTVNPSTAGDGIYLLESDSANPCMLWQAYSNYGIFTMYERGDVQNVISTKLDGGGGGVIFNEKGYAFDFRIEGDTDQNLFFLDGSTDRIGIGDSTPSYKLDVNGTLRATGAATFDGTVTANGVITSTGVYLNPISNSPYTGSCWVKAITASKGIFLVNSAVSRWIGIKADGTAEISSSLLTVAADLSTTGNCTLGDSTSADSHTINGRLLVKPASIGYIDFLSNGSYACRIKNPNGNLHIGGGKIFLEYGAGDVVAATIDGATGNVLIGGSTSNLTYNKGLQITSASNVANLKLKSGSSTGFDLWQDTGGSGYIIVHDNAPLYLRTNNTNRLTISAAGSVTLRGNTNMGYISQYDNSVLCGFIGSGNSLSGGTNTDYTVRSVRHLDVLTNNSTTLRMRVQSDGNVGIGTASAGYKFHVQGDILASGAIMGNSKSFVIDHPTKPNHKLQYGALEGPEFGVYHRGRVQSDTIVMPDYWSGLVRDGTITVQLTPNGSFQHLYVVSTSLTEIKIGAADGETIDCYYTIYGERADLDPLVVEKIV